MTKIEYYAFPTGLHLLTRWQAGDKGAKEEMTRIFDEAIAGEFDENFAILAPPDRVNATASVHMLALAVLRMISMESSPGSTTTPILIAMSARQSDREPHLGVHKY